MTALETFVNAVDAIGGVAYDENATAYLESDPEWTDLAAAYLAACAELGRKPLVTLEYVEQEVSALADRLSAMGDLSVFREVFGTGDVEVDVTAFDEKTLRYLYENYCTDKE